MYKIEELNTKTYSELFSLYCDHYYGIDVYLTRSQLLEELLNIEG